MNRKLLLILLIFTLPNSYASADLDSYGIKGKWAGIEVLGVDKPTRKKIEELVAINIGSDVDTNQIKPLCEKITYNFNDKKIDCGIIGFLNGEYYLSIDFSDENSAKYRKILSNSNFNTKISMEINDQIKAYDERLMKLITSGVNPGEHCVNGYYDYQDTALHEIAMKLLDLNRKNNDSLLEIVRFENDEKVRAKAAKLLGWSHERYNLDYIIKWNLMYDPNRTVSNNLSRSIHCAMKNIKDKNRTKELIKLFCDQANFSEHADRTKALSNLNEIFEIRPELIKNVNATCKKTIRDISENSILPNVGGVAKSLLKKMGESSDV